MAYGCPVLRLRSSHVRNRRENMLSLLCFLLGLPLMLPSSPYYPPAPAFTPSQREQRYRPACPQSARPIPLSLLPPSPAAPAPRSSESQPRRALQAALPQRKVVASCARWTRASERSVPTAGQPLSSARREPCAWEQSSAWPAP